VETNTHQVINATHKLYSCEAEQEEDSTSSDSDEYTNEENEALNTKPKEEAIPGISLTAITSIVQPQTLRLRGHIRKENASVSRHGEHS